MIILIIKKCNWNKISSNFIEKSLNFKVLVRFISQNLITN